MKTVALLKGDGIGPEISDAVVFILDRMKLGFKWEPLLCGEEAMAKGLPPLPPETLKRVEELKLALKGPTATPIGKGHSSANVALRKSMDLYANVRPIKNLPGIKTPFENIDLIIVRENTEDLYAGKESQISPGVMQSLKIITDAASRRIARYAFDLADRLSRKKVTCVHKANIMKMTDGLFLEVFREVAKDFPKIEATDLIVDNTCMQLVTKPHQFDVIVTENLYGDIISDLCAGLIGGLGVAGGANIGKDVAVFEAVHGTAPDIAGKGVCNPTALLLSSVMMLEHLGMMEDAKRLRSAIFKVYTEGKTLTRDLKGSASTAQFAEEVCRNL